MSQLSRRCFLRHSVIAASAMAVLYLSFGAEPHSVRFGVRGPFKSKNLRERALLLKKLGYDGIELGHEFLNRSADSIREELDGTGIAVSAIVGSIKLLDPDSKVRAEAIELDRQRLELARVLGAVGVIEVPTFGPCKFPGTAGSAATPLQLEDQLLTDALKQLAPDVKKTGVVILLEPLVKKETHYMNLQSHGARIIEAAGGQCARLLSDFYHMQMEEKDIAATLTQYGKFTGYVHMADGVKRTEPGSLPFDYRPGFRALKKLGYSGWLTVESSATDNAEAALARALPYVKRQWQEA